MAKQPRYALLDPRSHRFYTGDTLVELIVATRRVLFDDTRRVLLIDNIPDTVSSSSDYAGAELKEELAKRALLVLTRDYGCFFYKSEETAHG